METLEYFFECYFNMSADYSELDKLIKEFIEIESDTYIKNLKIEIGKVLSEKDWDTIVKIASLKGGRRLNTIKAEKLIKNIQLIICKKGIIDKNEFYSL